MSATFVEATTYAILTWDIHDFPLSLIDFWAQSCWNSQLWMKVRYMFFYGNRIWLIWPIGNDICIFSVFNTHSFTHALWPKCETSFFLVMALRI